MLHLWIRHFRSFTPHTIHRMFWLALAFLALGAFIKLTWELREGDDLVEIDRTLLLAIAEYRTKSLNGPALDVTALGSPTLVTLFTALGLTFLLLARDSIGAIHLLVSSVGAGIWTRLFKHLVSRERPVEVSHIVDVSGFSYPSGHSLTAAAIFMTLAVLASRHFRKLSHRLVIFGFAFFILSSVGLSRAYLGVHYPSDILSGICFGSAWSLLLAGIFSVRYWKRREQRANAEVQA